MEGLEDGRQVLSGQAIQQCGERVHLVDEILPSLGCGRSCATSTNLSEPFVVALIYGGKVHADLDEPGPDRAEVARQVHCLTTGADQRTGDLVHARDRERI